MVLNIYTLYSRVIVGYSNSSSSSRVTTTTDGSCIWCSAPQKRCEVIAPLTAAVAVAAAVCIDVADFLPKRPSYFCVCVCLCALVRVSISHAEGSEYYYFDLLHPPAIDECSGLSLFRAVRRTRHVIIPPQHHRNDGGWNEISKTLQKPLFFFRTSFPPKKISLYPSPRVATVKLSASRSSSRPDTAADTRTPGEVVSQYSCPDRLVLVLLCTSSYLRHVGIL